MNRSSRVAAIVSAAVALSGLPVAAQTSRDSQPAAPGRPVSEAASPAAARDVESLDAILGALYDVISGPAGRQADCRDASDEDHREQRQRWPRAHRTRG